MKLWKWLFYLILILFPFGQIISFRLSFLPVSIRIHPLDFVCFVFLFYWIIFFKKKSKPPFFVKSAFAFLLIASLSLFIKYFAIPQNEILPAFLYLIRLISYFFLSWAFFDFFNHYKIPLYEILTYEGAAIAGLSVLQYLFLPDTRFLLIFGWDDHLFRAIGPFLDPSFNGLILILSLIVVWVNYWEEKDKTKKFTFLTAGILIIIAVIAGFSRMNYLLLIISCTVIFSIKRKIKLLVFLIVLVFAVIFIFPKPTGEGVNLFRTSTTEAKIINYRQIISIIKDNFWTGVGFNAIRVEMAKRNYLHVLDWQESHSGSGADNSFLLVFATTGIFGFLSYVYYWISILKSKKAIFITTIICLFISAFFINSLFYPWILCWWGLILAFTAEISK